MDYQKADLVPRLLAAVIDGIVAWVFVVIPVIGAIIGSVYLLLKDYIIYQINKSEEWENRSIGKKIMGLKVVRLDGRDIDATTSVKRNLPITIGNIIAIVPLLGWVFGPMISLIFAIVEILLIITNDNGRRLGDYWAETQVIEDHFVN